MDLWQQQIGIMIGVIGFVWSSTWFLSKQFASTLEKVYIKIEALQKNIIDKLEYHERHDDQRFAEINTNLWELRLRQVERGMGFDQKAQENPTRS